MIVVAFSIREVFSFWTGHPFDFELYVRLGYWMLHGGNPYGVLSQAPGLSFANIFSATNNATIAYLPLWPFVAGLQYWLYSLLGLNDRFVYYFLLKQPVILGDIGLGYMIYTYISRRGSHSTWALRFWFFMPFTIIISSVWGTFDSLAMFFVLLSLSTSSYVRRSVYEGVAILAKSIPVVFAIPLTLKGIRRAWGLAIAIGIPAVVTLTTTVYFHWPFQSTASTLASATAKGGESMSAFDIIYFASLVGMLPKSFPLLITGLIWIPGVLAATLLALRRFGRYDDNAIVQVMLVAITTFLLLKAQVNEQYAVYFLAIALIDVSIWHPERKRLLYLSVVISTVYLLVNNLLLIRFVSPAFPSAVSLDSSLDYNLGLVRQLPKLILGICFTIVNLLYLTAILKQKDKRDGFKN